MGISNKTIFNKPIGIRGGFAPLVAGGLTALLVALVVQVKGGVGVDDGRLPALNSPINDENIQEEGPLLDGNKITLEEAKSSAASDLPVPITDARTGSRAGIWSDASGQIAFVWTSDLRYYINRLEGETTKSDFVKSWEEKSQQSDSSEQKQPAELLSVRGEPAIGHDLIEGSVSNLTFIEKGYILQFVSPVHSLSELDEIAESIEYE